MPLGSEEVFRHGVASGDPLPDRVFLWTRVSGDTEDPVEVRWTVALDEGLEDVVASGTAVARAEQNHTVHVDAAGLSPGTAYWYGFDGLGASSRTGRTKTLPHGRPERIRFGVCSCAKYTAGHFNVYGRLADRDDLDFLLHLGDYIYELGNDDPNAPAGEIGRAAEPPHECITLEDYRRRYAHHRLDPDLQRLHARLPFISTLDDHEICDNTWREGAKRHDPSEGPWVEREAAALRAWREWLPVRLPSEDPLQVFRRFRIGELADLVVLDGRTRRDEESGAPEVMDDPERTILGPEQERWLLDLLEGSDAMWRLLGNSVMIGQVYTRLMPEDVGEPLGELGVLTKREHGPEPDQWDGYPAARDRLFQAVEEHRVGNVVFLSGDVHTAWAVDLKRDVADEQERALAVEFVTPSVTTANLDEHLADAPAGLTSEEIEEHVCEGNPHVRWVDLDRHGFIAVDVTAERVQADWWFADGVREPSDAVEHGASWLVRSGEHGLTEGGGPTSRA
jgi:alkaline phosphatase D